MTCNGAKYWRISLTAAPGGEPLRDLETHGNPLPALLLTHILMLIVAAQVNLTCPNMNMNKTSALMGILQEKTKTRKFKIKLVSKHRGERARRKL